MLFRAAQRLRHSRAARTLARVGLTARAFFYLLLAYLAAGVAAGWGSSDTQANAHGALATIDAQPGGALALVAAAVGFGAFGLLRLASAYADRRVGGWRRLTTAGQATFYLAMAGGTVAYLMGEHGTGSAQQQDSTAMMLVGSPAGRLVMAATGLGIVAVCSWQLLLALRGGFADSLVTDHLSRRARSTLHRVGQVGIVARAAAVLPVGGLLLLAAVRGRPGEARDLDELLDALARDPVGQPLVWVTAAGFLVFGLYSLLEARYRAVHAGD